eukprot:TRINITY_DN4293_c0_g1_i1.p1 TRINITY_DN4293_c0_g1~~TRINITY_DN4293_c0_g1_i1.p1  ORF type:complete len:385 (-),score=89.71 TRINITY_DN4293_c0_g1_i1:165-1319(-)
MEWVRRQIHQVKTARLVNRVSEDIALQAAAHDAEPPIPAPPPSPLLFPPIAAASPFSHIPDTGMQNSKDNNNDDDYSAVLSSSSVNTSSSAAVARHHHRQPSQATVVKVTITVQCIDNVPPFGLDAAIGCRVKPTGAGALFEPQDSPTVAVGYRTSVLFDPFWSITFKCVLQKADSHNAPSAVLKPVPIKISVRKFKAGMSSKDFKRFGTIHLNIADYAVPCQEEHEVKDRKLLENCTFNSIIQFAVKIESIDKQEHSRQVLSNVLDGCANIEKLLPIPRAVGDLNQVHVLSSSGNAVAYGSKGVVVDDMDANILEDSALLELLGDASRRGSVNSLSSGSNAKSKGLGPRRRAVSAASAPSPFAQVDEIMESVMNNRSKTHQSA